MLKTIDQYFDKLSEDERMHSIVVKQLVVKMAAFSCQKLDLKSLSMAAKYHDVGKLCVPSNILYKNDKLSDSEKIDIMKHVKYGADLLAKLGFSKKVITYVLMHHENVDGSGYPFCLKYDEIAPEARILRCADVYAALRSKRIYKEAYSHEKTMNIMEQEKHYYDKNILKIMKSCDVDMLFDKLNNRVYY
jgi:putative nucleotidyltransferase with HDIG domain